MRSPKHSGNILFIILIVVALFAALSYAITTGTRTSTKNVNTEQLDLLAAQIVEYGNNIENAIMRLMVSHGCSDTEISFHRPPFIGSDIYYNPNAPTDFSCHIFTLTEGQSLTEKKR